jgi:glutamine synthetase type III
MMNALRKEADALDPLQRELWPLPTFQELMFIR